MGGLSEFVDHGAVGDGVKLDADSSGKLVLRDKTDRKHESVAFDILLRALMGLRFSSTSAMVTPSTLSLP